MKKLSESIWGDIRKRADGIEQRKEDKGNIDSILPVDFGCSVLWADRDFEIGGEYLFTMKEVEEFLKNMNGWRLPTRSEAEELGDIYSNIGTDKYVDHLSIKYKQKELKFMRRGRISASTGNPNVQNVKAYYCWTSTEIGSQNFRGMYITNYEFAVNLTVNRIDRVCLRLVKDRDINESVWGDMRRRAEGVSIRKEDETNIKDMKPVDLGLSVLWADRDLEVQGDSYFTAEEGIEISNGTGWRVPTNQEMQELKEFHTPAHFMSFYDQPNFIIINKGKRLEFEMGKGYYYDTGVRAPSVGTYTFWSSTKSSTGEYYFSGSMEATHNRERMGTFICGFPSDKNSKRAVRLVKDK